MIAIKFAPSTSVATTFEVGSAVSAQANIKLWSDGTMDFKGGTTIYGRLGDTGGFDIQDPGTKPTCDSTERGMIWFDEGGAGVADTIEICVKSAADTYSWVALATF